MFSFQPGPDPCLGSAMSVVDEWGGKEAEWPADSVAQKGRRLTALFDEASPSAQKGRVGLLTGLFDEQGCSVLHGPRGLAFPGHLAPWFSILEPPQAVLSPTSAHVRVISDMNVCMTNIRDGLGLLLATRYVQHTRDRRPVPNQTHTLYRSDLRAASALADDYQLGRTITGLEAAGELLGVSLGRLQGLTSELVALHKSFKSQAATSPGGSTSELSFVAGSEVEHMAGATTPAASSVGGFEPSLGYLAQQALGRPRAPPPTPSLSPETARHLLPSSEPRFVCHDLRYFI